MSITLTDRDTGTLTLTTAASSADGVSYSVAGGSLSDYRSAMARHSGLDKVAGNSRHNVRLERRKINSLGAQKLLTVDITISVANDGTFSADDVDDAVTGLASYFDSEATTGNFITGVSKA